MEGEGESGEQVMSEVHLGCPPRFSGSYVTHFSFSLPPKADLIGEKIINLDKEGDLVPAGRKGDQNQYYTECQSLKLDDDGDLVLSRKCNSSFSGSICKLTIRHCITSSLPNVGLQVWTASLLLSDFLLHRSFMSSDFDDTTALELGAGTGLAGIVLSRIAKKVFLTDYGNEILDNCAKNVRLSSSFSELNESSILVRELNWKESWPPHTETFQKPKYSWTSSEVAEVERATLILAADVIYSDELTSSLFNILEKLMSRGSKKVLYLALEKRYNFSLDDLDVVANGYAKFRSFLEDEECMLPEEVSFPCFMGKQIDTWKIPQYIREYERGRDLELWRIRLCTNQSQLQDI
ncbi:methyltransferase-like protein 22 isoform X2 [Phalaenopsis equestris]|uniref:methyltransferase-like protein 22 isoform X2 n=1 Tax=Phalaenopsis equestris TaxID=78828 RepID=UPI0009E2E4FB|nr:methyltransferase-like protein 22 isoform X2 [Phalaenopsis equestris]